MSEPIKTPRWVLWAIVIVIPAVLLTGAIFIGRTHQYMDELARQRRQATPQPSSPEIVQNPVTSEPPEPAPEK